MSLIPADVTTSPRLTQPARMEWQSTCVDDLWQKRFSSGLFFRLFLFSQFVSCGLRLCLYYYFILNLPFSSLLFDFSYYLIYDFTYSLISLFIRVCWLCSSVQGFVLLLFDRFISIMITGHTQCVNIQGSWVLRNMYFEPCTMYRCSWWDCFITSKINRCTFIFRNFFVNTSIVV